MKYLKWLAVILVWSTAGTGFSSSSSAQDNRVGIQIAPLILEYSAEPGQELVGQLQLFDPLATPQTVQLKIWDFVPADEQGNLRFFEGFSDASAGQWIILRQNEASLGAKEEYILPFVIRIPPEARAGTHTAVVFAQTTDQSSGGLDVSRVQVAAGAIFLVDVVTAEVENPDLWSSRIVEVDLQGLNSIRGLPLNWVSGGLTPLVRFENTGRFQQQVLGEVRVRNIFGRVSSLGDPIRQRVLPQAVVQFKFPWRPDLLLGKYELEFKMTYGRHQQLDVRQKIPFWAIDLRGLSLVGIVGLIGLGLWYRRQAAPIDKQ